jgi:hypothetical protein
MLTELRERVYAVVRDSNRSFFTETDVDRWLNEGMEELSSRLHVTQGQRTDDDIPISGNLIPLPDDFRELIWLQIGGDQVEFVDEEVWNTWEEAGGSPSHSISRVFNGNIEIYPTPDSGSEYTMRYWTTSTTASNLTAPLRNKVVNFARAHAKYKEGDHGAGDRYMSMFEDGLPGPNVFGKTTPMTPSVIRFEGGPFDTVDATHI